MKPRKLPDRVGVVINGPEVIDSGWAISVLKLLEMFGSVFAVLGGTMGRLAVIDADLEDIISINARKTPSQSVHDLQASSDVIVLLNQAKNRQTGLAFGSRVAANARITRPLIQIDSGGILLPNWLAMILDLRRSWRRIYA